MFDSMLTMQHLQEKLSVQPAAPSSQVLRYLNKSTEDNKYAYRDSENHLFFSGVDSFLQSIEASAPFRINRFKSRLTVSRIGDEITFEILDEYESPVAFQIVRAENVAIDTVVVDSTNLDDRRSVHLSAEALYQMLSPGPGIRSTIASNLESFVSKMSQLLAELAAVASVEPCPEVGQAMNRHLVLGSSIRSRRADAEEVTNLIVRFRQVVDGSAWLVDPRFVDDVERLRRVGVETCPTDMVLDDMHLLRRVRNGYAVYRVSKSSLERVTPIIYHEPEVGQKLVFGMTKAGQRLMYNLETHALVSHAPEPVEALLPQQAAPTTAPRHFI